MASHMLASSFRCEGSYDADMERVVVLTQRDSPTCEHYLHTRLSNSPLPVHYWYLGDEPPVSLDGAFMVIVRYLDGRSAVELERNRERLCGVAYLLDDDLATASGDPTLPIHYRFVIGQFWFRYAHRLSALVSELWVSSNELSRRYAGATPVYRIDPAPVRFPLPRERSPVAPGKVRVFYHGQKTHAADRDWLADIVTRVVDACPEVEFELVGGPKLRWRYRHADRVSIRAAMPWPDYRTWSLAERFDIGLAPLVPTPFNSARSWIKYLDIARVGAVGVYAAGEPYGDVVADGGNGRLLSCAEKSTWVETLSRLVRDDSLRARMAAGVDWPKNVATPPFFMALAQHVAKVSTGSRADPEGE